MHDEELMKAATAVRRAANRLEDMDVQEVSLVDRAANLRTLVVTKRAPDANDEIFKSLFASELLAIAAEEMAVVAKILAEDR